MQNMIRIIFINLLLNYSVLNQPVGLLPEQTSIPMTEPVVLNNNQKSNKNFKDLDIQRLVTVRTQTNRLDDSDLKVHKLIAEKAIKELLFGIQQTDKVLSDGKPMEKLDLDLVNQQIDASVSSVLSDPRLIINILNQSKSDLQTGQSLISFGIQLTDSEQYPGVNSFERLIKGFDKVVNSPDVLSNPFFGLSTESNPNKLDNKEKLVF